MTGKITTCHWLAALLPAALAFSCRPASETPALTVAVAANAAPAIEELARTFHRETGRDVALIIGSSGKLSAQIQQGAPFDLLLSADAGYPEALIEQDKAVAPMAVYARGRLILWLRDTAGPERVALSRLQRPEIKRIALAQPGLAPYGRAAQEALDHYGLWAELQPKLVFGESISQVNQFLSTGAVEAGFTALSATHYSNLASRGRYLEVEPSAYGAIEQGMVITRYGVRNHPEAARAFFDFLQSEAARQTLERFGYRIPPN